VILIKIRSLTSVILIPVVWVLFDENSFQFLQFLGRSGIISRMVYMDSSIIGFCIRKAIGGARDEVWQYATLWFMGLHLRIQEWGFDLKDHFWDVNIMCIRQFQIYKYNCTSIIKTKKKIIQNPV